MFLATAYKASSLNALPVFITIQNVDLALELGFEYDNQIKFFSSYVENQAMFTSINIVEDVKSEKIIFWIQASTDAIRTKTVDTINFKGILALI